MKNNNKLPLYRVYAKSVSKKKSLGKLIFETPYKDLAIAKASISDPGTKVVEYNDREARIVKRVSRIEAKRKVEKVTRTLISEVFDEVREEYGEELWATDLFNLSNNILTAARLQAAFKQERLDGPQVAQSTLLFQRIVQLQVLAAEGDDIADLLLRAIQKSAFPPLTLPDGKKSKPSLVPQLERIVDQYNSSPHLVRAYEIRYLMYELSFVVDPVCTCFPKRRKWTIADALDYLDNSQQPCGCRTLRPESIVMLKDSVMSLSEPLHAESAKLISMMKAAEKSKISLLTLAKKIFVSRKDSSGDDHFVDMRVLNRDIQMLRKFESAPQALAYPPLILRLENGIALEYRIL